MSCRTISACPLASISFRLLLVVSLWEGPVLWGHTHTNATPGLAFHIGRLHSGDPAAMNMDWHWHLSVPDRNGDEQSERKLPTQSQPTLVRISAELAGFASSSLSAPATLTVGWGSIAACLQPQFMSRGACSTNTLNSSPQQMLCRMSC